MHGGVTVTLTSGSAVHLKTQRHDNKGQGNKNKREYLEEPRGKWDYKRVRKGTRVKQENSQKGTTRVRSHWRGNLGEVYDNIKCKFSQSHTPMFILTLMAW